MKKDITTQCQGNGFNSLNPNLDNTGEVLFLPNTKPSPVLCEYHSFICPKNIPKYSMKCIYHNKECSIKKYFDRFRKEDLDKLGLGSRV